MVIFGFVDEDELEEWYSSEKERLDSLFADSINANFDKVPEEREKYDAALKKLVARYQAASGQFVERRKGEKTPEEEAKAKEARKNDFRKMVARAKSDASDFLFKISHRK